MARVFIDGQQYDATEGDNLLQACLSQGLDLPYFCWHPAMGSVGACRQCAVVAYRDEEDTQGRLIMACMTPVTDGARISIQAAHARDFRANVIEWLMENHPHDCPVCEEGGECHLQDMTVMTGHTARQYRGNKRTYENQYLGPFINHEMNRCITCYRCVRFYRDYAGGTDLAAFGSRSRMYFGRAEPGVLENEFSGNLVEVCPTGVFTDKPFSKVYSRKWDLQSAPSLCTGCSVGCNTFASERYGTLKRIHNRYHPEVNRYFLCDRGRFGMSYVNSPERIRRVGVRIRPGVFAPQVPDAALTQAAEILREGGVLGIGSPRASLEDNWALRKLVGEDNFYSGFGAAEHHSMAAAARLGEFRAPSVSAMEAADAVLVLGEDLLNTAPRIALAIRQAAGNRAREMADEAAIPQWQDAGVRGHAQHERSPVFVASVLPTRLDDVAAGTCTLAPAALVRCGRAIAAALTTGDLDPTELGDAERVFATAAALALRDARQPLIVTGTSLGEPALVETAGAIARTLRETGRAASLAVCGSEANSFGMRQLPQLDQHVEDALQAVVDGRAQTLLVLQNDLFRRADAGLVTAALEAAKHVIVLDCLDTPTATAAEIVLPAATIPETTGTLVNYERRAQRFYQVFEAGDDIQPAWRWLTAIGRAAGRNELDWMHVDDLVADMAAAANLDAVATAGPDASYRAPWGQRIPREPHRYSGRTAMYADRTLHEPKSTVDEETPFSYSMEGANSEQPAGMLPYVWAPGWNSNQSLIKFQEEVGGALRGADLSALLRAPDVPPVPYYTGSAAEQPNADQFILVAQPVLFGGEELSAQAPAIQERAPRPFIVLNGTDAARLGVADGDGVRCGGHSLEVRTAAAMAPGTAAVSAGMPGAPAHLSPGPAALAGDPDFVRQPSIIARG